MGCGGSKTEVRTDNKDGPKSPKVKDSHDSSVSLSSQESCIPPRAGSPGPSLKEAELSKEDPDPGGPVSTQAEDYKVKDDTPAQETDTGVIKSGGDEDTPAPVQSAAAPSPSPPPPSPPPHSPSPPASSAAPDVSEPSEAPTHAKDASSAPAMDDDQPDAATSLGDIRASDEKREAEERLHTALRFACGIVTADSVLKAASPAVEKLQLPRGLPSHINISSLLQALPNLRVVDISNNNIGPQSFRALMLCMCHNFTITSLNVASNMADTDSAECVGKMLSSNQTLECLDVSGNYLGLDYFSRCVSMALTTNDTLQILRCEGIGSTDMISMLDSLKENSTLTELDISHNTLETSKQHAEAISRWMQARTCKLSTLRVRNCGFQDDDVTHFTEAMRVNSSLSSLDISSNQVANVNILMYLVEASIYHSNMHHLTADDTKSMADGQGPWQPAVSEPMLGPSHLVTLNLAGCNLTDELITTLVSCVGNHAMADLLDLNLTNNPNLSMQSLNGFIRLSSGACHSSLEKLSWGLNSVDGLTTLLVCGMLPNLSYLNLRKSMINVAILSEMAPAMRMENLSTLVLDGIKLSGSNVLQDLFGEGDKCHLVALSLSSCNLVDKDLEQLCVGIKRGLPLHMLKLSVNRIGDVGISHLVTALLAQDTHPLKLIDLSNNQIGTNGANKLSSLFKSDSHKSCIQSLNISINSVGIEGLVALASCLEKSSLLSLHLQKQRETFDEEDLNELCEAVANALGLSVSKEGDLVKPASSDLPALPPNIMVRMDDLGGDAGELGRLLDSAAIITDFCKKRLPYMTFEHVLEMAAVLKGEASAKCSLSSEEWNTVISAEKEAPSWLQIQSHIDAALYVSNLPAMISIPKMEAVVENEIDCSVQDVFLMKDPVTRKNNGFAWVLLEDTASVNKAVQFMYDGLAQVFSQAFVMSKVNVTISDITEDMKAARMEMQERARRQRADEVAHRQLIKNKYVESQERHAWRLAHPAYADGRIW